MENASKALIIAGAILIAILIISLGVMIFQNFGSTAKNMANLNEQEISAFNSKITPYLGKNISGSQVNALIQYAVTVNNNAQSTGETYRCIEISGSGGVVLQKDGKFSSTQKKVETGKYYEVERNTRCKWFND